jgi:hypothetical protein
MAEARFSDVELMFAILCDSNDKKRELKLEKPIDDSEMVRLRKGECRR